MNKEIEEALEKVKEYAPEINAIGFNSNELNEDNTIFNNALDTIKDHINAQQDKLDRIKGELEQYKTISIGIDFTSKERNAIVIVQVFKDHLYQLYGKTFSHNEEVSIQLKDLIEQKSKGEYSEFELDYLKEEKK
jgi:hypothetical protein